MSNKKILFISPYFYPENFPINNFIIALQKFEYEIEILTCLPNYRNNSFYKGYGLFKGPYIDKFYKSKIYRLPCIPRKSNSFFSIFLFYFSYFIISFFFILYFAIRNRNKYHHVTSFCGSPVYVGFLSTLFSYLSNCTSSQWIQDIWPEAIITSFKFNKKNFMFKIIDRIQNVMWNSCDILFSQSYLLTNYLNNNFINKKIITLNNSPREKFKLNIDKKNYYRKNNVINISYFGNIGKTQNLNFFIENFIRLNKKNYFFNICGDGNELLNLKKKYSNIKNIKFYGWLTTEEINNISDNTQYFYLSLNQIGRQKYIIPSKFQTYINYNKPIIFFGDENLSKLINDNNLGFSVTVFNKEFFLKLFDNVWQINDLNYQKMLKSINEYNIKNYSIDNLVKIYLRGIDK